jgi:nitric oxide reductase NorD protein
MTFAGPLSAEYMTKELEACLEVEFNFFRIEPLVETLSALPRETQDFVVDWVKRAASAHVQIGYEFASHVVPALDRLERRVIEAWAVHAMDTYDRQGLRPALEVVREVDHFVAHAHARAEGAFFEEIRPVLLTFLRGLSGRRLSLAQGEAVYTDSETLFLPNVIASMQKARDNFVLAKAMIAFMWAQTRFGSFLVDYERALSGFADREGALQALAALDALRLEGCLARELPGLWRDMCALPGRNVRDDVWKDFARRLAEPSAGMAEVLALLPQAVEMTLPEAPPWRAELRPQAVLQCMAARIAREKMLLRVKLAELAKAQQPGEQPQTEHDRRDAAEPARFGLKESDTEGHGFELTLEDKPIAPPDDVRQLIVSIRLDLGGIPPEYLTAAGDGEYEPALYGDNSKDPDEVWQGTYHEEGAFLYPEWDYARKHYRKNWSVVREKDIRPGAEDYAAGVVEKHTGLLKHLRRTFEAMRDENRLLKRQEQGDDIDIDALVEAIADSRDGSEMSDRLFQHMHRAERSMAVMFMVDMSGSTKGWINDAEREALIMLSEALETLGDRYAIYGFSGITRKRCEIFRVKGFGESYDDEVKARIAGIAPQEYTRMGPAIRHLSKLLLEVEARTRLLVTLSDGKPDDYFDIYRGRYGVEDTRQALLEAKRSGIHAFCITIDREAREYLPHMYGHAHYVILDDVRQLPLKVADIYRRITT